MSFIDKLKSGMSEASTKAKVLVEVNKLRLINSSKNNEMNQHYQEIGKMVVAAAEKGEALEHSQYQSLIEKIQILKFEIEQNIMQINNLSDQKECPSCNKPNPIDAKFCNKCGHAFKIYDGDKQKTYYLE